MKKFLLFLALLLFPTLAQAQSARNPCYYATPSSVGCNSVTSITPLPVTGTLTVGGNTFGATFPAAGTAGGMSQGGNFVPFTGTSNNLNVNCVTGCSGGGGGGTVSNASSGVATSSTNTGAVSWLYGFNGTTWDQLQVNGSKALKVDGSATTQPVSLTSTTITGTVAATQSGTWNIGTVTTLPALPANQSTNEAQINGVAPLMGNGLSGTGSQRVNIASDNTAFSVNAIQSGTWNIGNITGTVSLPTGAATAAGLTTINTTLGIPFQAGGSIGNTSFAATQATAASLNATVVGTGTFATQLTGATNNLNNISGTISLPTGAATAANQTNASQKTQIVDGSGNVIAATSNALNVAVVSGGGTGGTSSSFSAAFPATGTAVGMTQGGNMIALSGTSGNLNVQCANCSGSGASAVDEAAFTAGTSVFAPAGGFFQTTATSNPLTNGQQGLAQMTANRAVFNNLRNAAGTEVGTSSTPLQVSLANTATNATAVKVDGSAVTQPVSLTSTTITGSVAVTGTFWQATQPVSIATAPVLVAGTALIGKVGIDQTTVGTTNAVSLAQIGANTVSTGNGVSGIGVQRVAIASDNTAFTVNVGAAATGGASTTGNIAANNTTAVVVKASAGTVYSVQLAGLGSAPAYLKLYNATSATCGSGTPVKRLMIPAASTAANGAGSNISFPVGVNFSTGITYCVTTGIADADTTAPAASTFLVNIDWL